MTTRRRRIVPPLVLAAVVTIVALVGWTLTAAPPRPPAYIGPKPVPEESGLVAATHSVLIDASPDVVYAWANDPDRSLEDLVQASGGMPRVVGTQIVHGDWIPGARTGDRRRVAFADGHFLAEEVLADSPDRFRYQIWGFTGPQRFAISYGVAEFGFRAEGDRTRLTWTYAFRPTSVLLRPFVAVFLNRVMSPMMEQTLAAIKEGSE